MPGYEPPRNHSFWNDIRRVSIGTDAGLALETRKGTDPNPLCCAGGALVLVVALIPARRASRADPASLLRQE
jgi:hypothetical protein